MSDSWSFRTARGRAEVADGHLRVERSPAGFARGTYRKKWVRADRMHKGFFVLSILTTALTCWRLAPAIPTLVESGIGSVTVVQWLPLAALVVVAIAVARKSTGSEEIPLAAVESVTRTARTLRVAHGDDGSESLELDARTDADAEAAVEMLRLKGIRVENHSDADGDEEAKHRESDAEDVNGYVSARARLAEEND